MSSFNTDATHGVDLDALLSRMLDVAQKAGDLVLAMQAKGLAQIGSKSNKTDLVTEADVASEKLIHSELHQSYPTFGFWGEESNQAPSTEFFWVVDPIDGTNNFANGLPYFAVNIALNRGPATLVGVTLALPARHLYFAQLGRGAYYRSADGRDLQLHVNKVDDLSDAFLTTGFPYHRTDHADHNLAEFGYFLAHSQGVRCMGTSAMDLVNVAGGAFAAYWEGWLSPWDAAPGALLVREAGGLVTDYLGRPWQLTSRSLIASNGRPNLHAALIAGIQSARQNLTAIRLPASELA